MHTNSIPQTRIGPQWLSMPKRLKVPKQQISGKNLSDLTQVVTVSLLFTLELIILFSSVIICFIWYAQKMPVHSKFPLLHEVCLVYLFKRETISPSLSAPCLQSSRRLLTSAWESIAAIVDIIFAICDDQHTTFPEECLAKQRARSPLGDNCLLQVKTSSAARMGYGLERKVTEFDWVATANNKHRQFDAISTFKIQKQDTRRNSCAPPCSKPIRYFFHSYVSFSFESALKISITVSIFNLCDSYRTNQTNNVQILTDSVYYCAYINLR